MTLALPETERFFVHAKLTTDFMKTLSRDTPANEWLHALGNFSAREV
jgi:hypothetical protein